MTSTPLMERPRNDRTYSAVVPGLVPTAFTHLAWRFRGGDKYRCRPGACPRDPLAFARGDAVCGLLPGQPLARSTLPSCSDKAAKALGPGNKRSEERRVGKECVSKCRSRWSPYH